MIERVKATERSPHSTASLLHHYGFDLGDGTSGRNTIAQLLSAWQEQYPADWIRLATIEALYQGRYKAISVAQILALWQRRSQPIYHFNHEFERLICDRLPQTLAPLAPSIQEESSSTRSTQAMAAKLQHHNVVSEATPTLPTPTVMQALRTLHDDATAALPLADSSAESIVESNEPSLVQTCSDLLQLNRQRSDEPPSQPLSQKSESLTQSNLDPTLLPVDITASASAVNDETLQAGLIALPNTRSDVEQPRTIHPANSATSLSSVSSGAQVQPTTSQAASIARILQHLDDQVSTKTMVPSVGLLDQTLKPKLRLHLTARYQPIWLTDLSNQPIHQFTPASEPSDFHHKLKSVAHVSDRQAKESDGEPCDPLSRP